jgi:Ca-activated chloride channel family protein
MKNERLYYPKISWSILILVVSGIIACAQSTRPANSEYTDKNASPYFVVLSEESSAEQLPLKSTKVDVNIAGVIADVNVKQVYSNTGTTPIEAIYIFPASTRAAVYNMVMKIDEREIIAIVEEKSKARNMYETAKEQGKTASLLEEHRPNVFQMNVANIVPGATVEVTLSYTEMLIPTDKVYEFVYPTVVGPRYVSQAEIETGADKWTGNPYLEEGVKPSSSFDISINVEAGMPIKEIRCETHQHSLNFTGKSVANLKLEETAGGNRDFIMQYRLAGNKIDRGILLYEDEKGEKYFMALMQPPKQITANQIPSREYVFIVDVSGSMSGFPLDVSKELMNNLLGKLNTRDKFNIVFFAGGSNVYAEKSLPATKENISKALAFLDNIHGGGGTELLNALRTAMSLNHEKGFARSFVILTDGYVSVEKETFDYIRNNLGNANFFSFGIGSSVNRHLIEGMAHVGYGEPFIALDKPEAKKMARKFNKYVSTPVLTNIEFTFNEFEVYDVLPNKIPDLFAERPLVISGKYKGEVTGDLTIRGKQGERMYNSTWKLTENSSESKKAIKYLWAREQIRLLADYNNLRNDEVTRKKITNLGIEYNLLTEFTSFIAIDSEISNPTKNLTSVKQPLPLPQGVSNSAIGKSSKYGYTRRAHHVAEGAFFKSAEADLSVELSEVIEFEEEEEKAEEEVFTIVEEMPRFQNGDVSKFLEYLQKELKFPESSLEGSIQGRIFAQFTVNEKGEVVDIKILRGISPELDAEVIRALKASPKWTPGKQRGKPVKVNYTIPIVF